MTPQKLRSCIKIFLYYFISFCGNEVYLIRFMRVSFKSYYFEYKNVFIRKVTKKIEYLSEFWITFTLIFHSICQIIHTSIKIYRFIFKNYIYIYKTGRLKWDVCELSKISFFLYLFKYFKWMTLWNMSKVLKAMFLFI